MDSQSYLSGLIDGSAIWAISTFALFHTFNVLGVIQNEASWAWVQGITALLLIGLVILKFVLKCRTRRSRQQLNR